MASLRGVVNFPATTLTAGTTYYPFVVAAPANRRVVIGGFGFYGQAGVPATPGAFSLRRSSSQGGGGSVLTPASLDGDDPETFASSWVSLPSTFPSDSDAGDYLINPQLGLADRFPDDCNFVVGGGGFLAFRFIPAWTGPYCGWVNFLE